MILLLMLILMTLIKPYETCRGVLPTSPNPNLPRAMRIIWHDLMFHATRTESSKSAAGPGAVAYSIGSNLDSVTSERMRCMYVTHDKRYSKEWDILHQKWWNMIKYKIWRDCEDIHTESYRAYPTYIWANIDISVEPCSPHLQAHRGLDWLPQGGRCFGVQALPTHSGKWPWTAVYPGMKGSWTKAGSAFAIQKVCRASTPTDHVTTETLVESLEEQTGQCTWWKLVIKASMWRCVGTNLRPHLCWGETMVDEVPIYSCVWSGHPWAAWLLHPIPRHSASVLARFLIGKCQHRLTTSSHLHWNAVWLQSNRISGETSRCHL